MKFRKKWSMPIISTVLVVFICAMIGFGICGCKKEESQQEKQIESVEHPADDYTPPKAPVSLGSYKDCKIAFRSDADRDGYENIHIMNPDGSGQTRLTGKSGEDAGPFWSPDGKKIAFMSYRDGKGGIYVMNPDGSEQKKVTSSAADDSPSMLTGLSWSPVGKRIAFLWDGRDGTLEIHIINADGSEHKNLTSGHPNTLWFSFSPDGERIAFASNRDGNEEIYLVNADGGGQENLTNNPGRDLYPSWSPDGKKIVFMSERDRNKEIYVMNPDGSEQKNLTNNPGLDTLPSWSPILPSENSIE
jgi:TolB protein